MRSEQIIVPAVWSTWHIEHQGSKLQGGPPRDQSPQEGETKISQSRPPRDNTQTHCTEPEPRSPHKPWLPSPNVWDPLHHKQQR